MLKIGALVSGGGTNLQAVIDAIKAGKINAEIAAVVSSKKDAYALVRAKENGIEAVYMRKKDYENRGDDAYEKALVGYFQSKDVGLVLYSGFLTILSPYFIKFYENRIMNVHPALIPAFCGKGYYGIHVHEAVIESGVKVTGATVHFATEVCDSGPIILQKCVPVLDDDTPETLQKRVMEQAEHIIFPAAVRLFAEGRLKIVGNRVIVIRNISKGNDERDANNSRRI